MQYVPEDIRCDHDFGLSAIARNKEVMCYMPETLRNSKSFVQEAVHVDGDVLQFVPDHFKLDREVVLAAVQSASEARVAKESGDDVDNAYSFLAQPCDGHNTQGVERLDPWHSALVYASGELKRDQQFILAAVEMDTNALRHAAAELRED